MKTLVPDRASSSPIPLCCGCQVPRVNDDKALASLSDDRMEASAQKPFDHFNDKYTENTSEGRPWITKEHVRSYPPICYKSGERRC